MCASLGYTNIHSKLGHTTIEPPLFHPWTCMHILIPGSSPMVTWRSLPTTIGKGRHAHMCTIDSHYYIQPCPSPPLLVYQCCIQKQKGLVCDITHKTSQLSKRGRSGIALVTKANSWAGQSVVMHIAYTLTISRFHLDSNVGITCITSHTGPSSHLFCMQHRTGD